MPNLSDNEYKRFRELLDKDAIRDVVMRYCRAIDRVDGELLRTVYWPDGWDSHSIFDGPVDEFIPWVVDTLNGMIATQHFVGNVSIELDGEHAYTEIYFNAHHKVAADDGSERDSIAAGRYLDHFERRGDEWRIKHRRAIFDWDLNQPSTSSWSSSRASNVAGNVMERGTRGPQDLVYSRAHFK
jgi:hypothetical protein